MPLALNVFAAQRVSMLIKTGWIMLDPHIVESARTAFKAHLYDRTLRVEQKGRFFPKETCLVGRPVARDYNGLCHDGLPSRKRGVGFMVRRISTARSNRTGLSG